METNTNFVNLSRSVLFGIKMSQTNFGKKIKTYISYSITFPFFFFFFKNRDFYEIMWKNYCKPRQAT